MKHDRPFVLLITSDKIRHKYVAHQINQILPLVGIVCERKQEAGYRENLSSLKLTERLIFQQHFDEMQRKEMEYFGQIQDFPIKEVFYQEYGNINSIEVLYWIQEHQPDIIVLYGCSIVKSPLLELYRNRIVNMHLGLSPYYRGSATNFWPLVNREPECVGVTIHLAEEKVDAGPILAQGRPTPSPYDRCHDLGCKTIIEGVRLLVKSIISYYQGRLHPVPQQQGIGKFYRSKDFCAEAIQTMWHHFDNGMMEEFIANYLARVERFPIVEWI